MVSGRSEDVTRATEYIKEYLEKRGAKNRKQERTDEELRTSQKIVLAVK